MPIYEYRCGKCGHEFEREQRIVEDPIKKCPACRSLKAKRLISKTSFVLKGGGWYSDLYSSAKPGGGSDDAGSSDSKSEPKSDSKGDSKSESKGGSADGGSKKKKGTPKKKSAA